MKPNPLILFLDRAMGRKVLDCTSPQALRWLLASRRRRRAAALQDAIAPTPAHQNVMGRRVFSLLVATILFTFSSAFAADNPAVAFDAANRLYEQGKFAEAAGAYESILQRGSVSAGLLYNLGNAQFKAGEVGRALVSYRRAESMAPRDPDVRANLQFVRGQIQGATLPPARLQRWLGSLTLNEWSVFASLALWLWLLLLMWRQWQPSLKRALRSIVLCLGGVAFVACLCLGVRLLLDSAPTAVVIAPDAAVRTGPLEDARTAFIAHDGAELRVLDQKDDWLQVSAGGQWLGWVKREQVISPLLK